MLSSRAWLTFDNCAAWRERPLAHHPSVKLALIGAGGFRAPLMHLAVARSAERLGIDDVVAYDIDEGRLERIGTVTRALSERERVPIVYTATTSLDEALEGADFIFCAIRVGGIEGRVIDEMVPLAEGVVGQETTGPGGIGFALRTIPVVREIAEVASRRSPAAWFLNFTNPAGLVTEALRPIVGDKVIGICDGPSGLFGRVAAALGRPEDELDFDYFGLNHLGWLKGVRAAGVDLLPELLADDDRLARLEEGQIFTPEWLRSLGMIPNEYLYYYYSASEAVAATKANGLTRAQHILRAQSSFYNGDGVRTSDEQFSIWQAILKDREATYMPEAGLSPDRAAGTDVGDSADGYTGVAIATIEAITRNTNRILILNTVNRGSLPFLPDDAVVEVPCVVGAGGVRPLAVGSIPLHARGLIEVMKDVERTTIEAIDKGSSALAVKALSLHPLVPSRETAARIFGGYVAQHSEIRERFAPATR